VAKKSIGGISNNDSTLHIGTSPALEAAVAGVSVVGTGICGGFGARFAGLGTTKKIDRITTLRCIIHRGPNDTNFELDMAVDLLQSRGPNRTYDEVIMVTKTDGEKSIYRYRKVNSNLMIDTITYEPAEYDAEWSLVRSPITENMFATAIVLAMIAFVYFWWTSS
jgi:hypothetical protein